MTPAELGRFMWEEVPRIRKFQLIASKTERELLSALDAAMGVLRRLATTPAILHALGTKHTGECRCPLCDSCLVLGEGWEG